METIKTETTEDKENTEVKESAESTATEASATEAPATKTPATEAPAAKAPAAKAPERTTRSSERRPQSDNRGGRPGGAQRGDQRPRTGGGGYNQRTPRFRRKNCRFCYNKEQKIDYKDASTLSHCISNRGKIMSRRKTKACAKHQRRLALAIKRARFLALLPYAPGHIWKTGGVGLRH